MFYIRFFFSCTHFFSVENFHIALIITVSFIWLAQCDAIHKIFINKHFSFSLFQFLMFVFWPVYLPYCVLTSAFEPLASIFACFCSLNIECLSLDLFNRVTSVQCPLSYFFMAISFVKLSSYVFLLNFLSLCLSAVFDLLLLLLS